MASTMTGLDDIRKHAVAFANEKYRAFISSTHAWNRNNDDDARVVLRHAFDACVEYASILFPSNDIVSRLKDMRELYLQDDDTADEATDSILEAFSMSEAWQAAGMEVVNLLGAADFVDDGSEFFLIAAAHLLWPKSMRSYAKGRPSNMPANGAQHDGSTRAIEIAGLLNRTIDEFRNFVDRLIVPHFPPVTRAMNCFLDGYAGIEVRRSCSGDHACVEVVERGIHVWQIYDDESVPDLNDKMRIILKTRLADWMHRDYIVEWQIMRGAADLLWTNVYTEPRARGYPWGYRWECPWKRVTPRATLAQVRVVECPKNRSRFIGLCGCKIS